MKSSDISHPSHMPPVSLGIRSLCWVIGFAPHVSSPRRPVAMVHGHRWTSPIIDTGDKRLSQVPGEPMCVHAPLSDPGGPAFPGHHEKDRCCLPDFAHRRPHDYALRGSITQPTRLLSTLHSVGHPNPAQDSLPVRWLGVNGTGLSPVGFHTRISSRLSKPPFPTSQTYLAHAILQLLAVTMAW